MCCWHFGVLGFGCSGVSGIVDRGLEFGYFVGLGLRVSDLGAGRFGECSS